MKQKKFKFDLLDKLENYLQRSRNYHRSWWIIVFLNVFLLGLTAIPLGYIYGDKNAAVDQNLLANHHAFTEPAEILVYFSYALIVLPYVFLAGSWISGINNTSRSKYLHFFIWICNSVAALFILLAIILAFRAGMY